MKIKNIMFSGFAAAIFAGVCGAASAATTYELTSKSYVDNKFSANTQAIADEATARSEADAAIRGEFAAADKALDAAYKAADTDLAADISVNAQAIEDEVTARTDADSQIRTDFAAADKALENAYKLADTGLQSQIDAVKALTGETGVADQISTAVNAEKSAREQADAAIRTDFAAADSTLDGKISANTQAIADETSARADADTAMAEDIADLVTADTTLDGKISTEASARETADTQIRTDFAAADTAIRSDFATADTATLSTAQGYTDTEIDKLEASLGTTSGDLTALKTRVDTAEGEIDDLQAADSTIRGEFAAADEALEEAYKAADTAIAADVAENAQAIANEKSAREAADTAIRGEFADADTAVLNAINAENFVSANGILTTKGGYLVISDGNGKVSLNQVAVVNGDGTTDIITGESLQQ